MKISIIRGKFLNPFELQNYYPLIHKHNITAISSKNPINSNIKLPLKKLLSPADLPPFPYKYPILNRLMPDAHYLFKLNQAIKGSNIAHVAETYYHYSKQAIDAKKQGLVDKVISTVWEIIPFNNQSLPGRRKIKQYTLQHIDHFLAVTELAKQALIKEGVGESKITVIPIGVNLHDFSPEHRNKNTKDIRVLYVGRLVPQKGILELVNTFLELSRKHQHIHLTIIGNGHLKKQIKNQSNSNITIKTTPYHQIHQEYKKADIFCLLSKPTPTWQEQFGMVLVEAMASGLPILTTKSGAIPEVCGSTAIYTNPTNNNQLQTKLNQLITDENLRNQLGTKARQRAENNFDFEKIASRIDRLYHIVNS